MTQVDAQIQVKIEKALNKMLKGSVPVISTNLLADFIGSESDWVLLDSRERAEFEISHLPNAKWVGCSDFTLSRVTGIARNAKVVVYCSIGVRSENIAEKLTAFGFSNVLNLYGGIFTWANEQRVFVDNDQAPTLVVHGYDKSWAKLVINSVCPT